MSLLLYTAWGKVCNSTDVLWPVFVLRRGSSGSAQTRHEDRDRPRDDAAGGGGEEAEMQGQRGVREERWADQDRVQEAANKFVYVLPRLVPDIGGNLRASSPHLASHPTSRGVDEISWNTIFRENTLKMEGSLLAKSPVCYSIAFWISIPILGLETVFKYLLQIVWTRNTIAKLCCHLYRSPQQPALGLTPATTRTFITSSSCCRQHHSHQLGWHWHS